MAVRAVQIPALTGITPTYNAAAAGDQFAAGPTTRVHVKNADAAAHTVTSAVTAHAIAGDTVTLPAVNVAAGAEAVIGPFPSGLFGDASGNVSLTWSATTGMSWSVFS